MKHYEIFILFFFPLYLNNDRPLNCLYELTEQLYTVYNFTKELEEIFAVTTRYQLADHNTRATNLSFWTYLMADMFRSG